MIAEKRKHAVNRIRLFLRPMCHCLLSSRTSTALQRNARYKPAAMVKRFAELHVVGEEA